jgi:hypothetical protein
MTIRIKKNPGSKPASQQNMEKGNYVYKAVKNMKVESHFERFS